MNHLREDIARSGKGNILYCSLFILSPQSFLPHGYSKLATKKFVLQRQQECISNNYFFSFAPEVCRR